MTINKRLNHRGLSCPPMEYSAVSKNVNTSISMESVHNIMCKRYIYLHLVYTYILYMYATELYV